ncbi:dTMP kinase [Mangrovibrevibacter kandeliae]|uniref:dTMP kinase n=1 Tax=Mangrovibrevibacter kandeliae TaxID=2968473 RepID=UPI0021181CE5|nr:dTMP kinase [Aurantimonas sp. CSK15Z-1]MCQ8782620.1 dTMP kinase [Aurantimonas sp. CSK15Z-1]
MDASLSSQSVPGFFITFEGGEGSGKTTQIERLAGWLREEGRDVVTTREPGGSPGADALRYVILSGAAEAFGEEVEAILFAAARADHVAQLIRPALEAGRIVISDRFHDSTRVYQGLGSDMDTELLDCLERAALSGVYPDLTIVLDLPAADGLRRAAARRGKALPDRFEKEDVAVHESRRRGFLGIAEMESDRCVVVDARQPVNAVADEIARIVEDRLSAHRLERVGHSLGAAVQGAGGA